uniref:Putative secreted protein n=1 Tax=Ixodes ricinus TaxID=34613 RepID=A0A6B0U3N7_IXORI
MIIRLVSIILCCHLVRMAETAASTNLQNLCYPESFIFIVRYRYLSLFFTCSDFAHGTVVYECVCRGVIFTMQ